jgi:PAS domain S-box-containing protein
VSSVNLIPAFLNEAEHLIVGIINETGMILSANKGLSSLLKRHNNQPTFLFTQLFSGEHHQEIEYKLHALINEQIKHHHFRYTLHPQPEQSDKIEIEGELQLDIKNNSKYIWFTGFVNQTAKVGITSAVEGIADRDINFINAMPEGYIQLNKDTRILFINPAAKVLLDTVEHTYIGNSIKDYNLNNLNLNQIIYALDAWPRERLKNSFLIHTINYERYFYCNIYNNADMFTLVITECTEEQKKTQLLIEQASQLNAWLNYSNDAFIFLDNKIHIQLFNKAGEKLIESYFNQHIHVGESFKPYLANFNLETFDLHYNIALSGNSSESEHVTDINGKSVSFKFTYIPLFDLSKKLLGVVFHILDISEQRAAEKKLQDAKHIIAAVYESASYAKLFFSPNGLLMFMNSPAKEIFINLNANVKMYDTYLSCLSFIEVNSLEAAFNKALEGKVFEKDFTINEEWHAVTFFPVYENSIIIGVAVNIRNVHERALMIKQLKLKNNVLNDLAWRMSHDVRRPVANILGLIDIIKEENDQQTKNKALEYLEVATKDLDGMLHKMVNETYIRFEKFPDLE